MGTPRFATGGERYSNRLSVSQSIMTWKDAQINKTVQSIVGLENLPKDSKNRDAIERISSQLVDKAEKPMQGKNGGGSGGTGAAANAAGAVASLARSASKMAGAVVPDPVKLKAPFGISEERKEEIRHRRATMDRYLPWNERNICWDQSFLACRAHRVRCMYDRRAAHHHAGASARTPPSGANNRLACRRAAGAVIARVVVSRSVASRSPRCCAAPAGSSSTRWKTFPSRSPPRRRNSSTLAASECETPPPRRPRKRWTKRAIFAQMCNVPGHVDRAK